MKRRPINKDKYGISKHRYLEVIHHCLQYPEWREELENMTDTVKAIQYGQEGRGVQARRQLQNAWLSNVRSYRKNVNESSRQQ